MTQPPVDAIASKGIALASLIAGIVSLLIMGVFFTTAAGGVVLFLGVVVGAAAIVLGIVALKQRQPKGAAVTGIVTGAIGFLLSTAIFVFALIFIGAFTAS